jgi:hypothetical protein
MHAAEGTSGEPPNSSGRTCPSGRRNTATVFTVP